MIMDLVGEHTFPHLIDKRERALRTPFCDLLNIAGVILITTTTLLFNIHSGVAVRIHFGVQNDRAEASKEAWKEGLQEGFRGMRSHIAIRKAANPDPR